MADCRRARQACIRPAELIRDAGMQHREAFDMHFIDDGFVPWRPWRAVVPPGERGIDDPRQRSKRGAVAWIELQVGFPERISEQAIVPLQATSDRLAVGIEHQLVGIEAVSLRGLVWPLHPVAVLLVWSPLCPVVVRDPR